MKRKIILFGLLFLSINSINSQNNNLAKKWFLGFEIGNNSIKTVSKKYEKKVQYGFFSEYYYTKNFSVTFRIKKHQSGFYDNGYAKKIISDIIAIPINLKWEFTLIKNLRADINLGLSHVYENNIVFETGVNNGATSTESTTLNSGFGGTYYISTKIGVYLNYENYLYFFKNGGKPNALFLYHKNNSHINFGIKYQLK